MIDKNLYAHYLTITYINFYDNDSAFVNRRTKLFVYGLILELTHKSKKKILTANQSRVSQQIGLG